MQKTQPILRATQPRNPIAVSMISCRVEERLTRSLCHTFLLALTLMALTGCANTEVAIKKEMIALDRAYIPTLLFTKQRNIEKSRDAIMKLQLSWEHFFNGHYRDYPDTTWRSAFDRVGGLISRADGLLNTGDKTEAAHDALEEVRVILSQMRKNYHISIFSDFLTDFHEPMESISSAVAGVTAESLTDSTLNLLQKATLEAHTRWTIVDTLTLSKNLYKVTDTEWTKLRLWIDEESSHLESLKDALLAGDKVAIVVSARRIKPLFVKTYSFFGDFKE